MKKSFLLIPVVVSILSACSSSTPAPVENADGNLSPGIMQPVDSPSAGHATWEPQIQQQDMPVDMDQPIARTSQNTLPQPIPQPRPVYQQPEPQPVTPAQPASKKTTTSTKKVSQDFTIPRDEATNAPDYSKIEKGFYKGNSYTVRKGDTMFLVAYIAGIDVHQLAALNNMTEPYSLTVGQVLKMPNNGGTATTEKVAPTVAKASAPAPKPVEPEVTYTTAANGTQYGSDGTIRGPIKAGSAEDVAPTGVIRASAGTYTPKPVMTSTTSSTTTVRSTQQTSVVSNVSWRWPTDGRIVQGFSNSDGGNKGIDISGSRGQAVNAAAAGTVVYAGNALRGYGNLIIVKHNDDFLSAYAHNEKILVKDQEKVSSGQKIATMGSSGTNGVKLHFEIRQRGVSVDPIRYLPKR